MATFYGSDTTCVSDLPLIDLQITAPRTLIGQRLARRLQTPRGGLSVIGDDPNFGWDVRQYLNSKLGPTDIARAQQEIESECLKDEEVQSVTCTMSLSNGTLTITVAALSSDGPFTLTLNVGQLTTTVVLSF